MKKVITFLLLIMYNLSSFAQSERLISNLISSGGSNMSIDNIHLKASMGQTIIGVTNFNNTKNSQGFWYVVSNQSLTTSNDLEPITSELNVNIYPNPLSLNGILELNCENYHLSFIATCHSRKNVTVNCVQ